MLLRGNGRDESLGQDQRQFNGYVMFHLPCIFSLFTFKIILRRTLGCESEINEHVSEHHMTSRFKQFFQQTNFHRFYRNRIVDSKSNIIITAKIFVAAFCQLLYNVFKEYQIETITYKYKIFVMQTCYIERKMNVDNLQDIKLTLKSIVQ